MGDTEENKSDISENLRKEFEKTGKKIAEFSRNKM